jgi:hypothetical protein
MNVTPQWLRSIQAETRDNPGPHSRRNEWPVREEHGRLQWSNLTPQRLEAVPDFELSIEGRQARGLVKDARARAQAAALAYLGALLVLAGLLMGGCRVTTNAPVTALPVPPKIVVLSERVGSVAADIIETATGQRPFAASVPGLPVIVFSPKDASDRCLMVHEQRHHTDQQNMGAARFAAEYTRELLDCERTKARAYCLRNIELEAVAYEEQHKCQAEGATP